MRQVDGAVCMAFLLVVRAIGIMCGIAFLLGSSPVDQATIEGFLAALGRRGPDATGRQSIQLEVRRHSRPSLCSINSSSVSWCLLLLELRCLCAVRNARLLLQTAEKHHGIASMWAQRTSGVV